MNDTASIGITSSAHYNNEKFMDTSAGTPGLYDRQTNPQFLNYNNDVTGLVCFFILIIFISFFL